MQYCKGIGATDRNVGCTEIGCAKADCNGCGIDITTTSRGSALVLENVKLVRTRGIGDRDIENESGKIDF